MAIETNHWISYNWILNQSLPNLIHPDDLSKVDFGIGLAYCFDFRDDYFYIRVKDKTIRVKDFEWSFLMPTPKFGYNQRVSEKNRSEINGFIEEIGYHDKEKSYFYYLKIGDRVKKKRYMENELIEFTI